MENNFIKTIYFVATSMDGFIADKNDSLDWLFKNGPTDVSFIDEFVATVGSIAMGSSTYKWLLENSTGPWPYKVPCLVFTSQNLEKAVGADIQFVNGDVSSQHENLKKLAQGKNIWVMGGGELVAQFYDNDLLDEMIVQTISVFLNEGKKLFPRKTDNTFKIKKIKLRGDNCSEIVYSIK